MKNSARVSLFVAGALVVFSATAHATVTFSVSGPLSAPPATPSGSVVLENFDGTTGAGVTERSYFNNLGPGQTTCTPGTPGVTCSTGILSSGTTAFPAPPGDTTNFLALSTVPIPTFVFGVGYVPPAGGVGFFDLFFPSNVSSISFYTGNVSAYVSVSALQNPSGTAPYTSATSESSTQLGIVGSGPNSGREVTISFAPSDNVTGIELVIGYNTADGQGGTANGFDVDNFTATLSPTSVPEPSSVAMLSVGAIGMLGAAMRRRRAPTS